MNDDPNENDTADYEVNQNKKTTRKSFFFYGNEHLHNKYKNNSHLASWLLWVPGIQKKVTTKGKN